LHQALLAKQSGADRVEICGRLETGGMTPDYEIVKTMCEQLIIPVRVMIRSTEEGFEADEFNLQEMLQSIDHFKNLSIDGFVIGVMKNNAIDREAMRQIINHTSPLPVTFHKAIDESEKLAEDVRWLNEFQEIDTILTSGGALKANEGAAKILEMKSLFHGTIMAGGKILPGQLPALHELLGLHWYHGRGIVGDLEK